MSDVNHGRVALFLRVLGVVLSAAALALAAWARSLVPLAVGLILAGAAAFRHVRTFDGLRALAGPNADRVRFSRVFLADRARRGTRWLAYVAAPLALAGALGLLLALGRFRLLGLWAGFGILIGIDILAQRVLERRCQEALETASRIDRGTSRP
ncbi:MAG: hypothetical protein ABI333_14345 [bacterium]